jgi:hypothetical protein
MTDKICWSEKEQQYYSYELENELVSAATPIK